MCEPLPCVLLLFETRPYLPPAEDTLVCTGEAGGRLHTPVGLNAIERVFVTASSPSQHRLKKIKNKKNIEEFVSLPHEW